MVSEDQLDDLAVLLVPFIEWASDQPEVEPLECKVAGCERVVLARGWCGLHYGRWHRMENMT